MLWSRVTIEREDQLPLPDPALYQAARDLAERAPLPAAARNLWFGTAGWADKGLIGSHLFYPRGVRSAEKRLAFYASHFNVVEVDATFYTIFPSEQAEQWLAWAPAPFLFNIKAFPSITGHAFELQRLPRDLREACEKAGHRGRVYPEKMPLSLLDALEERFVAFLAPFLREQRLGALLVQFPPWFDATRGNVRRIEAVAKKWSEYPLAVEFRHASWFDSERYDRVMSLLKDNNMSYVCADAPAGPRAALPLLAVTQPKFAVLRFHGQNAAGWAKEGASLLERFDYLYSPAELAQWVPKLNDLAARVEKVYAIFNNGIRDYAILNAKGMCVLMEKAKVGDEGALAQNALI